MRISHAHFFSVRTSHVTARVAQGMMSLCESSRNHSSIGHVVVGCSFDSILSFVFFIFHLSYNASELSNAIPCPTPLGDGLSGRLAGPIPSTGYEPKFCIDVDSEHMPNNLPSRNMSFQQEYNATITRTSIDLDIQELQAPAASTRQQAQFPLC